MTVMNTYIDALYYLRAPTGLPTSIFVGTVAQLVTGGVQTGNVSLPLVTPTAAQLNLNDQVYIFDGSQSEIVLVTAPTPADSFAIPVSAVQFAHAAGVCICTDGTKGSLGQQIVNASELLESICYQALLQTTYSAEILRMPTMRAAIDNRGVLEFRPRHFPVTALTSLSISTTQAQNIPYDTTQAFLDSDRQMVSLPELVPLPTQNGGSGVAPYVAAPPLSRRDTAWLTLVYTAGYAASALPGDVLLAATLLTSDNIAQAYNSYGAAQIQRGKQNVVFGLRGDLTGDSVLYKRAAKILSRYSIDPF